MTTTTFWFLYMTRSRNPRLAALRHAPHARSAPECDSRPSSSIQPHLLPWRRLGRLYFYGSQNTFLFITLHAVSHLQIVFSVQKIGIDLQCGLIFTNRVLHAAKIVKRNPKIIVRVSIVRFDSNRVGIMDDGFFMSSLVSKEKPQIKLGLIVIGINPYCLDVMVNGLLNLSQISQSCP